MSQPERPRFTFDQAWLSRRTEEILEPALPIIDPHHHLWEHPGSTRYMMPDLLADLGSGHDVRATVFAECSAFYRADGPPELRPVGETEFVAAASAGTRACAGIFGHADLFLGEAVRPVLEAHIAAAGGRFRGIRYSCPWEATDTVRSTGRRTWQGMLLDPKFRAGFATLAPLSLSFDSWLYHPQIVDLADLAGAFPDTTIILDHVGGPLGIGPYAGRRDAVFTEWRAAIRDLARRPNVNVKLGGLGMTIFGFGFHERETPPGSPDLAETWRPYMETCIEAFGPQRCMFESNFPVDKVSCSYAVLWNAFKRLATGATPDEKAALFAGTAARVYRLPPA
jgi:L-fuconolactonase